MDSILTKERRPSAPRFRLPPRPAAIRYQHPLVGVLRRYAKVFGDFERPLLRAAQDVNRIASVDDEAMFAKIIEAISHGCHAFDDLVDDTELPETDVRRIYDELLIEGRYEERPIGHGSRGLRPKGIYLKSEPAGNLRPGILDTRRLKQYDNEDGDEDEDDD